MIAALRGADIVLNFIRKQNATAHNMRTLEVPAAGSFSLVERTQEQAEKLFIEDQSIACFSTLDELVLKITRYLQSPEERQKITAASYKKVQQYTLKKQLSQFLQTVKELHA